MIVYGSTLSPFVRKVMAFGAEKGVALDLEAAGLGRGSAAFAEASPFGKIPALRDPGADAGRDFTIADSSAIVTYLEARHAEPNLIPLAPIARARAIWYDEFADTVLFAAGAKIFFNRVVAPRFMKRPGDAGAADAAERDELPPLLDYLERALPDSGFLVEDRLTLADIAVASPFVNLMHAEVAIDAARWPLVTGFVAAMLARPSFAGMVEAERRMLGAAA